MIYLFDQYEVDDEDLCLTRQGRRLPLEPRALAVLLLMLRSNGKLLKKDAILEAVWKNTIVEESTLSRAVALLRKQLGDDPRHPTFIETVPTLGYRFIAQVRASAPEEKPRVSTEVQSLATDPAPHVARGPARRIKPRSVWILIAILLLVGMGVLRFAFHPRPLVLEKKSIVLAEFSNSTGEPVSAIQSALRRAHSDHS